MVSAAAFGVCLSKIIQEAVLSPAKPKGIIVKENVLKDFLFTTYWLYRRTRQDGHLKEGYDSEFRRLTIELAQYLFDKNYPRVLTSDITAEGLAIYSMLDSATREIAGGGSGVTAPQAAIRMAEALYGEANNIQSTLNLSLIFGTIARIDKELFSKLFIVDQDDLGEIPALE